MIIKNDAVILTNHLPENSNLDCWCQYPLGLFSISTSDSKLWGTDILLAINLLTSGLNLKTQKDQEFEGQFLKQPKSFTLSNQI